MTEENNLSLEYFMNEVLNTVLKAKHAAPLATVDVNEKVKALATQYKAKDFDTVNADLAAAARQVKDELVAATGDDNEWWLDGMRNKAWLALFNKFLTA